MNTQCSTYLTSALKQLQYLDKVIISPKEIKNKLSVVIVLVVEAINQLATNPSQAFGTMYRAEAAVNSLLGTLKKAPQPIKDRLGIASGMITTAIKCASKAAA